MFRVLRILRLIEAASNVRALLETVYYSIPSLTNISGFLLLIFYIYAVLGMQLFGQVRPGTVINADFMNFQSFTNSIQMLFLFMTGEEWNNVMYDCMVQPPKCGVPINVTKTAEFYTQIPSLNASVPLNISSFIPAVPTVINNITWVAVNISGQLYNYTTVTRTEELLDESTCGTMVAPFYFVSLVMVTAFVISDLFVAIVLDTFETTLKLDKSDVRMADLHRFVDCWSTFDPEATMLVPTSVLPRLLSMLRPPLGISRRYNRTDVLHKTGQYQITDHDGQIHFFETLIPLARMVMTTNQTERQVREETERWRRIVLQSTRDLPIVRYRESPVTVDHYFCATYISAAYRGRQARLRCAKLRQEKRDLIASYQTSQPTSEAQRARSPDSTLPLHSGAQLSSNPLLAPAVSPTSLPGDPQTGSRPNSNATSARRSSGTPPASQAPDSADSTTKPTLSNSNSSGSLKGRRGASWATPTSTGSGTFLAKPPGQGGFTPTVFPNAN